MCGIFGFSAANGKTFNEATLRKIATITEQRGPHAFGFAWVDAKGRLRSYKQHGRITRNIGLLDMLAGASMLIGHTRYATQGDPESNVNNHPHPVDGGWFVHNGVIRRYREIVARHLLNVSSECDSEAIGHLIEQADGTLAERCAAAVRIAADSALAFAGLWRSPSRLVLVRAGNPVAIGDTAEGVYFASLPEGVPNAERFPDDTVAVFRGNAVTLRPLHAERGEMSFR